MRKYIANAIAFIVLLGGCVFPYRVNARPQEQLAVGAMFTEPRVIVAAIHDSGIVMSEPLFQRHLFTNPGETGVDAQGRDKATNGADDDNNGFVDDVHGWDFVDNDNDPSDPLDFSIPSPIAYHGSNSAYDIIMRSDQGAELMQRENRVQILPLRVLKSQDPADNKVQWFIDSTKYAQKFAQVNNFSIGGEGYYSEFEVELARFYFNGGVSVCGAGNDGVDASTMQNFVSPGSFAARIPGVITVTSLDSSKQVLNWVNFGPHVRFGVQTHLKSYVGQPAGTSQAASLSSGDVAILMSCRNFSAAELVFQLTRNATPLGIPAGLLMPIPQPDGSFAPGGELDARRAALDQSTFVLTMPTLKIKKTKAGKITGTMSATVDDLVFVGQRDSRQLDSGDQFSFLLKPGLGQLREVFVASRTTGSITTRKVIE